MRKQQSTPPVPPHTETKRVPASAATPKTSPVVTTASLIGHTERIHRLQTLSTRPLDLVKVQLARLKLQQKSNQLKPNTLPPQNTRKPRLSRN